MTSAAGDDFTRDGAVVLRGLFSDWVGPLRDGLDAIMAKPSPLERVYHPADGSAPFFQDLCNWRRIAEFEDFVRDSPAATTAAALMRSDTAQFFHDHVLVKEPGTAIVTPWHHDMPYYCVGGERTVSFWIALDPVQRATSLRCVAGSHLWGVTHRPKRFDGRDLYEGDQTQEIPDIDGSPDKYTILSWDMEPGDAVAFDFRTVHGAAGNSGRADRRRIVSMRWVGDGAVFVDRQGKGSPPFRHLALKDGEPLSGPDFPVFTVATEKTSRSES
jgi:ectoine hydroxylase-related dioxygenase (phytanoyl-CoA dioxygenase family)